MYKFHQNIQFDSNIQEVNKGLFLWIWKADEICPHLGISSEGNYFSLKISGKEERVNATNLLERAHKKAKKLLLLKLTDEISVEAITLVFQKYQSCQENACFCSAPILEVFGINKENGILFDLLNCLEERNAVNTVFAWNLSASFQGIPFYSATDVNNHLLKLAS